MDCSNDAILLRERVVELENRLQAIYDCRYVIGVRSELLALDVTDILDAAWRGDKDALHGAYLTALSRMRSYRARAEAMKDMWLKIRPTVDQFADSHNLFPADAKKRLEEIDAVFGLAT